MQFSYSFIFCDLFFAHLSNLQKISCVNFVKTCMRFLPWIWLAILSSSVASVVSDFSLILVSTFSRQLNMIAMLYYGDCQLSVEMWLLFTSHVWIIVWYLIDTFETAFSNLLWIFRVCNLLLNSRFFVLFWKHFEW